MSTAVLGFGLAPFGTAAFAFGTPATADGPSTGTLVASDLTQGAARFIDPVARTYVLDALGRMTGMGGVDQRVQLALSTRLGSSVVATLGLDLSSLDRISDSTRRRVEDAVAQALAGLVSSGEVALLSATLDRLGQTRVRLLVRWMDLATNAEKETAL